VIYATKAKKYLNYNSYIWSPLENLKHTHFKQLLSLSLPIILTQLGHVITGMVDNIFLGKIGKTELAAGILSNNLYLILLVFSIGMSYVLTPVITDAHINKQENEKASLLKNSLAINLLTSTFLFILLFFLSPVLGHMNQPKDVVELAIPFFDVLIFSIIPVSLFFVCKQYAEGHSNTKAALIISIAGNLLNIVLNYGLSQGKLGFPNMGYMGVCWATFISRMFMGVLFLFYVFKHPSLNSFVPYFKTAKINAYHFWLLFKDGVASGLQFTFEVAAFAIAGFFAGVFGKEEIDAHGIALSLASFTYMFASGIASASTIIVGNYNSLRNYDELHNSIKIAFKTVLTTMAFMALLFVIFNRVLPSFFTKEEDIIQISSQLLLIAALFQLFDGAQVTAIGILRGLEDYKFPTYLAFIGYWLLALPLCYLFAFVYDYSVIGIWAGLSIGLAFVSVTLYFRIRYLMAVKINSQDVISSH
jgi:MATE family multidrug resistance protein